VFASGISASPSGETIARARKTAMVARDTVPSWQKSGFGVWVSQPPVMFRAAM
jgi:hypothetical protein